MKHLIHTLSTGDPVWHDPENRTITIDFTAPRKVLSTSLLNGGYQEHLKQAFNHNSTPENGHCMVMKGNTYAEHMTISAAELGYDIEAVTGMGTAALMENVSICVERFAELTVTAIVTGGVEGNGGRVGDSTEHYLTVDKNLLHKPGTINIMLIIDADLPPGMLARALVTCTEAKTAALQELLAGSLYSTGLATGSGTDQTVVIANPSSSLYFESAGKHSKLGELIGKAVAPALKEALYKQSGLCADMQHSILRRLMRYGITGETLKMNGQSQWGEDDRTFESALAMADRHPVLVTYTSLYVHLMDQLQWKLLSADEVMQAATMLLKNMADAFGIPPIAVDGYALPAFLDAYQKQLSSILAVFPVETVTGMEAAE